MSDLVYTPGGVCFAFFFLFFAHSSTFQLLDNNKPWSQVSSLLLFSRVLAFNFYRAYGSAIPLLVDFSSSDANSRSRATRKSICAQDKVPTNSYDYMHSRGLELTKLTYTRLEDNLIRHRGDRYIIIKNENTLQL